MNTEKQRIEIAKICGWQWVLNHAEWRYMAKSGGYGKADGDENICGDALRKVPQFTSDLNAIHEAEKCLTKIEMIRYERELIFKIWNDGLDGDDRANLIRSTSKQRAEAMLRALGKWESAQ